MDSLFFVMQSIKNKIEKVNSLLIKQFGVPPRQVNLPDPVDMLIATILSQNTNDKNSYRAFSNLKNKFKTWDEAEVLSAEEIEQEIKVAGLGKQKSKAIKNFLSSLKQKNGTISLKYITEESNTKILSELTAFDGVGIKTASCVLLFALNKNICPVDTHVHRTVNRIGIVKASTPDKTFLKLNDNIPEGTAHSFHTNLIRLGREICKPQKPFCAACPLLKICGYENKNLDKPGKIVQNDFMLLDNVK